MAEERRLVLPDRAAWLEARRQGIGASDAAAILGASPWRGPFAIYIEKLQLAEVEDAESEALYWGRELEPLIADYYQKKTQRAVIDLGKYTILRHAEHPWMLATLDRELHDDTRGPGVLEIKTASRFEAEDWVHEPPLPYQIQVQHQFAVTGYAWGVLALLVGGQAFHSIEVQRNDRFIDLLIEQESLFWDLIQKREPPPPDSTDHCGALLRQLFPQDDGSTVILPPEADVWDAELVQLKADLKLADERKALLENQIKACIGSATVGQLPSGARYSWKASPRKGYIVEPTIVRALRRLA